MTSPQEVNLFHKQDDADSSPFAHHHTIGTKPNQAADGKVVAELLTSFGSVAEAVTELQTEINTGWIDYDANPRPNAGVWTAFTLNVSRYRILFYMVDVDIWFDVTNAGSAGVGEYIKINLPVACLSANPTIIGYGRENFATGSFLQVALVEGSTNIAGIFRYDNAGVAHEAARAYHVRLRYPVAP